MKKKLVSLSFSLLLLIPVISHANPCIEISVVPYRTCVERLVNAAGTLSAVVGAVAVMGGLVTLAQDSYDAEKKSNGLMALSAGMALIAAGCVIKK